MRAIDVRIQGRWLRRRGLRGRWITVYVHRYGGQESTERLHSHTRIERAADVRTDSPRSVSRPGLPSGSNP